MTDDTNGKREGSVPLKGSNGKNKSKEIDIDDDITLGAMKVEISRKFAVGKSRGEISTAKTSESFSEVKIVREEGVADIDLNSTSEGQCSAAKKINSGRFIKVLREEEGMETKPVMENKENIRIPVKRKRGADGELVLAYLSIPERSSSRLRPRKDVPSFRMVDLDENDDHRIVGKRVKVYWPDSRKWFTGNIKAFDDKKRLHSISYDDGDREELDLRKERFELEIMHNEGFSLKVDLKKKARGLDGGEASRVMSREENFVVEYTDNVTKTPEQKNEKSSKKVGKSGSSKTQRKFTKPKQHLSDEIHAAKELGEKSDESKPLAGIARKAAGKLEAKTYRLMLSSEGETKGSDNDDSDSIYITSGDLVKKFGSSNKITQGGRNMESSKLLSRKEASEVETQVADMVVDVCNDNKLKKSTVHSEINAEEAVTVNHQTQNEKTEALEEVGESNTGVSRKSKVPTLDFNATTKQASV